MAEQSAYPLTWPEGWPRTPARERVWGHFKGTPDKVRREMLEEIDRIVLGKESSKLTVRHNVIVSTNVRLRRDGEPSAGLPEPADTGVAVYFRRRGKPMSFACDRYDRVWKNMRAIQLTIEALRGIDRWGSSQMMERAFTGFAALPPPTSAPDNCWSVLELPFASPADLIQERYRLLAQVRHPDRGGSQEAMAALNKARDEAMAAIKEGPRA